jgi:hypothetical protein
MGASVGGERAIPKEDGGTIGGLGWNAGFAVNFNRHIGLMADFDGLYYREAPRKEGGTFYHYLVGPTFCYPGEGKPVRFNTGRAVVFVLVGGVKAKDGSLPSSSGFAMKIGVGGYGNPWGVQFSYLMERFGEDTTHLFYLSADINFVF